VNAQRCAALPVFGADLTALIRAIRRPSEVVVEESEDASRFWDHSSTLRNLVLTVEDRVYGRGGRDGSQAAKKGRPQFDAAGQEITSLHDMLTQYVCMIPKARAVSPTVSLSGLAGGGNIALPISAAELASQEKLRDMRGVFSGFQDLCRPAYIRQQLSFPDKRLLQYDCGKLQMMLMMMMMMMMVMMVGGGLQVMDQMFHKFRAEGHRVLLFTQMSKVLDVIEEFLSFHGFTYVRLDGSTKVEHRQMLVERFNQDPKIFCFISSTRSGGVGINLTGGTNPVRVTRTGG
ncbi:P-loop containing nucleoside triphosphate hydrolase protein, partial [Baffinella frigidus]